MKKAYKELYIKSLDSIQLKDKQIDELVTRNAKLNHEINVYKYLGSLMGLIALVEAYLILGV